MRFECKVCLAHVMSVMLHSLSLTMTSCFVCCIFQNSQVLGLTLPLKHVYRYNLWVLFCVMSLKGSFSRTVPHQEILTLLVTEHITF